MSDSQELDNLGKLSEVGCKLIDKISDAVGGIARPWQTVRVATAEAKAEIIHAQARVQISEIERRGLERMVREEGKKQQNIESITAQAIPLLTDQSKPENLSDDWVSNFFDKSKIVSDSEMQALWSKLLAGEANIPGTFSKRSIQVLSSLDKSDAELFSRLCSFCFTLTFSNMVIPVIFDANDKYCRDQNIDFSALTNITSLGLIEFNSVTGFHVNGAGAALLISYFDETYHINMKLNTASQYEIRTGRVLMTKAGVELVKLTQAKKIDGYADYVLSKWQADGQIVSYNRVNFVKPAKL